MTEVKKTGLVVSAHPGDFVWRAGGAIALHAKKGYRVKIVCLSFGERGESQFAWKEPGVTLEKVKAGRKDEAERAAEHAGRGNRVLRRRRLSVAADRHAYRPLVDIFREINPSFVLTHALEDPYNFDHPKPRTMRRRPAWWRRRWATSRGAKYNYARRRCSCSSRTSRKCAISSRR